jgi:hypothetical protein
MTIILKGGVKHWTCGLKNPTPVVDYILRAIQSTAIVDVYILAGQSNAVGCSDAATYTPAPFPVALRNLPNVMFWPGNNWHWPDEGQPAGNIYTDLLRNVKNALQSLKNQGKEYRLAGLLWMQDEHEGSIRPSMANDYQMLLTGLISHLRADLGKANIPVVVGEISDAWIFHGAAQNAQNNVCSNDPYAALVKTRDLPRPAGDHGHYTTNDMVTLGSRFAEATQTLQAPRY